MAFISENARKVMLGLHVLEDATTLLSAKVAKIAERRKKKQRLKWNAKKVKKKLTSNHFLN